MPSALREIWWSANSDSAITYRQRVGLFTRPSVGVVVQTLLDPDTAGVMFTENPVTGADERVIEASWGLGEAVVAGLVIPDTSGSTARVRCSSGRPDSSRSRSARSDGRHRRGGRSRPSSSSSSASTTPSSTELNRLAAALRGGLRPRPRHRVGDRRRDALPAAVPRRHERGSSPGRGTRTPNRRRTAPSRSCARCRSSPSSTTREVEQIARLFKERRFAEGETVVKEGSGGAAFFVIESGRGDGLDRRQGARDALKPGDYFGEIALIDEGSAMATITAATDLVCYGLTYWDFRPLVEAERRDRLEAPAVDGEDAARRAAGRPQLAACPRRSGRYFVPF